MRVFAKEEKVKKLLVLVVAVSVVSITILGHVAAVRAVSTEYFGEDLGLGEWIRLSAWPNADAGEADFLSRLIGVGTEDFESYVHNTGTPLAITFPGAGTATIEGNGRVYYQPGVAVGRYPTSVDKYWETSGDFSITLDSPVAAFGFHGIDIGDFNGQVTLNLVNGGNRTFTINNTINGTGGSVLYYGIIEEDPALQFTQVVFSNTESGVDGFGFDDLTIGSLEQIITDYIEVPVDIKPTSCRNPLNMKSKGVLPVAILGTEDFDVTQVDRASVRLGNVSPLRWALDDVATPFEPYIGKEGAFDCTTDGPDGFMDLTLKFDMQALITELGDVEDGDVLVIQLTGKLMEEYGGTPIVGEDVVVILKKGNK